jgi:hypothetical protein
VTGCWASFEGEAEVVNIFEGESLIDGSVLCVFSDADLTVEFCTCDEQRDGAAIERKITFNGVMRLEVELLPNVLGAEKFGIIAKKASEDGFVGYDYCVALVGYGRVVARAASVEIEGKRGADVPV